MRTHTNTHHETFLFRCQCAMITIKAGFFSIILAWLLSHASHRAGLGEPLLLHWDNIFSIWQKNKTKPKNFSLHFCATDSHYDWSESVLLSFEFQNTFALPPQRPNFRKSVSVWKFDVTGRNTLQQHDKLWPQNPQLKSAWHCWNRK